MVWNIYPEFRWREFSINETLSFRLSSDAWGSNYTTLHGCLTILVTKLWDVPYPNDVSATLHACHHVWINTSHGLPPLVENSMRCTFHTRAVPYQPSFWFVRKVWKYVFRVTAMWNNGMSYLSRIMCKAMYKKFDYQLMAIVRLSPHH